MRKTWIEFDINSRTDKYGKCFFWLYWMDDYNPSDPNCTAENPCKRGQAYYADPTEFGYHRPEWARHDLMANHK